MGDRLRGPERAEVHERVAGRQRSTKRWIGGRRSMSASSSSVPRGGGCGPRRRLPAARSSARSGSSPEKITCTMWRRDAAPRGRDRLGDRDRADEQATPSQPALLAQLAAQRLHQRLAAARRRRRAAASRARPCFSWRTSSTSLAAVQQRAHAEAGRLVHHAPADPVEPKPPSPRSRVARGRRLEHRRARGSATPRAARCGSPGSTANAALRSVLTQQHARPRRGSRRRSGPAR